MSSLSGYQIVFFCNVMHQCYYSSDIFCVLRLPWTFIETFFAWFRSQWMTRFAHCTDLKADENRVSNQVTKTQSHFYAYFSNHFFRSTFPWEQNKKEIWVQSCFRCSEPKTLFSPNRNSNFLLMKRRCASSVKFSALSFAKEKVFDRLFYIENILTGKYFNQRITY